MSTLEKGNSPPLWGKLKGRRTKKKKQNRASQLLNSIPHTQQGKNQSQLRE
jgi:hypothetical protein